MTAIEQILAKAKALSGADRDELLRRLEDLTTGPANDPLPSGGSGYARSLAASGTGHSDFPNVSSDKYEHLGEAYVAGHTG